MFKLDTRIVVAGFLSLVAIALFSSTALANCTCQHYGHCSARASGDWPPTSYDQQSKQIVFYVDKNLNRRSQDLIRNAIERWRPAMSSTGLSYMIIQSTTPGEHGIHELTIGSIRGNDGSTLGVTHDYGVHHRHIIIDRGFWDGSAACFWLSNQTGKWIFMRDIRTKQECLEQDSCNGGFGRSGGGCYKWAVTATGQREPWGRLQSRPWHMGQHPDQKRVAVVAHEIGHVIGLGHSSDHGDLMHDHYNPTNMYPTGRDLKRATELLQKAGRRR